MREYGCCGSVLTSSHSEAQLDVHSTFPPHPHTLRKLPSVSPTDRPTDCLPAGPGFINVRVSSQWLGDYITE